MAILGQDGRIRLFREVPEPEGFGPSALNKNLKAINAPGTTFWSGDKVVISTSAGIPTIATPIGTIQWVGVGSYDKGSTRQHIVNDASQYWQVDDNVPTWQELVPGNLTEAEYYIHIDEFDRISFYNTLDGALSGEVENRISLVAADWGSLLVTSAESEEDEWEFLSNLSSWSLETQSDAIDTTPIGAKFGEAVKSIVTGAGSIDFFIKRKDGLWNGIKTMRLAMLTQKGAKAKAWFFLTQKDDECEGRSIYYQADILIVACSLKVRIDEAIIGSARSATTGEIAHKIGSPDSI